MMPRVFATLVILSIVTPSRAEDPAAIEFFERKVRPILIDNCHSCHGEKKSMGGLRLDSRDAVLKGTDGGPVVVVGKPDESVLIRAIRYQGDHQMPPKKKLPDDAIAALVEWVKIGVPYPASKVGPTPSASEVAKNHWAFQPIKMPAVPMMGVSPIDAFVRVQLQRKNLTPSAPTDRRTLIRRAYFDLIGLPPTPEAVEQFANNPDPIAYERLVDKLLASPQYGERWARYWLDLSRYADTKGYVFTEDRNYPFAYTYRDYVIRSFNEDKPYDRFLIEQLAADQLELGDDKTPLAGMGFMTLGRRFLNSTPDIIDDRLDVLCRGLMGLTVTCARCHDHKFDPIPTRDYYSLYGIFASSTEPKDPPLIGEVMRTPELAMFEAEVEKKAKVVSDYVAKRHGEILISLRKPGPIADYLMAVRDEKPNDQEALRVLIRERDLNNLMFRRWRDFIKSRPKDDPTFAMWFALAAIPDAQFVAQSPAIIAKYPQLPLKSPKTIRDVASWYGEFLSDPASKILSGADSPFAVPMDQAEQLFNRVDQNRKRELQKQLDAFKATSPAAPARAMVLNDLPNPVEPVVFVRGNPNNRGAQVKRQFLEVLSGADRKPFTQGSGRLELAKAIASPQNPLTARVLVNRVWLNHFGKGLVATPSDFGVRSDPPTHPELLDYLSSKFIANGWSIKQLHREIMLSATYQQSSEERVNLKSADPENRLLGRMNRRRLDFESLRDSLLSVSGQLDGRVGGKSVNIFQVPFIPRRSVYAFIDRQNLPGTFRTFDFAIPDTHSPQRFQTTVPQQALFLMNSPFVIQQAKALIARNEIAEVSEPSRKVERLYSLILGRSPTDEERALAITFVSSVEVGTSTEWQYGYGSMDAKQRMTFAPLPHFARGVWAGGPNLPDPKLGWVILNNMGGHAGNDQQHATVRRWIAPTDGTYTINGFIHHPSMEGDGVRGRIVSSRAGVVASWDVQNRRQDANVVSVELKKGDTLDFVADCRTNPNNDSFQWETTIRRGSDGVTWESKRDFRGTREAVAAALTPWEQYAQVLLLANEFAFVD